MIHIYPIDDTHEHDINSTNCKCGPEIIDDGIEAIVIHSSFDGREGVAWANEILGNN